MDWPPLDHIVPAAAGVLARARERLRIDWTIPATWVVSLALGMLANLIVIVWKGSAIITKLEEHESHQAVHEKAVADEQARLRLKAEAAEALAIRSATRLDDHETRLNVQRKDISDIQAYERDEPHHVGKVK